MSTSDDAAEARDKRYNFLLGFLIERGVLTDKRYHNGTWSLQGIYGVDDSGLRGAGLSPEEAIDNAIVMANLDPEASRKFWSETHVALAAKQSSPTVQAQEAPAVPADSERLAKLCEENARIISGSPGPLYDIGWHDAANHCATLIRADAARHPTSGTEGEQA